MIIKKPFWFRELFNTNQIFSYQEDSLAYEMSRKFGGRVLDHLILDFAVPDDCEVMSVLTNEVPLEGGTLKQDKRRYSVVSQVEDSWKTEGQFENLKDANELAKRLVKYNYKVLVVKNHARTN